jgi:putative copper export protein
VSLGAATSRRILLGAGAAVSVGGFALTGHTQALEPPGAMPLAAAAHALIAGFWVVAPLTLQPVRPLLTGELLGRLQRFSTIATIAIPLLVVLGLWLAWILAGGWDRLVGTAYGQLLLLKLAAALAALGIGAFNRQYVTALVGVHPDRGRRLLGRTLAIETVLFATAILAVSAATTLTGAGE